MKPIVVYDRTSGDEESTGQDVAAGAAQVAAAVTARGSPDGPEDGVELQRQISAWRWWSEKRATRRRVQLAMDDIAAGRRQTRSGKAPGRPEKSITAEERAWCRQQLDAGTSFVKVHRGLLERRGYYAVTTKDAQRKRFIGRTTLQDLLAEEP